MQRERDIEQRLVKRVKAVGGWALKLSSQIEKGLPDRLICFPNGRCVFAELKRPGESPTPIQISRIKKLKRLGFTVYVVSSESDIACVLRHGMQSK